MAIREEYRAAQPLAGQRIMGSLHMTIQTAVLIETLVELGADRALGFVQHLLDPGPRRRRGGGGPERHIARSPQGMPVFAFKGETLEEYWDFTSRALDFGDGPRADADRRRRRRRHPADPQGLRVRERRRRPRPVETADSEEFAIVLALLGRIRKEDPSAGTASRPTIGGVSEETTTGVHRLYEMARDGKLLFPAINVNDSVTKSKFDNLYGCRHSIVDGLNRAQPT